MRASILDDVRQRPISGPFACCISQGTPGRAGEQHAVVNDAQYLDDAVCRHPVDDQVPWFRNPILGCHELAHGAKVKGSYPGEAGHLA